MKKMKTMLIIGVVLMAVGLILVIASVVGTNAKAKIVNRPDIETGSRIKTVVYWYGGSELGDAYEVRLKPNGIITVYNHPYVGANEITTAYEIKDVSIYKQIEAIVKACGMENWGELPESEIQVLDAANATLRICFNDAPEIFYSTTREWPEGGEDALRKIKELLESSCGKKISETKEKR